MKSSHLIAVVIAVFALVWIGSGFLFAGPEEATADNQTIAEHAGAEEKAVPDVRTRLLEAEDYADFVGVTGRSQASKTVSLRAEISGQIKTLAKEEGNPVTAGEVLAELEVRDREARLDEARQRVSQRQIEYNAAKKLEDRGFNSKVRLAQSLADLEDAKAAVKEAQVALQNTVLEAPFDGIIAEQSAEVGDYLSVGDAVFTVVNLDPIEFVGFVTERRIQEIEPGAEATAEFLDGRKITGKVSYIAPAANPQTRTFRVIVSAPNTDHAVKEGLTAKLHIPVARKKAHRISPSILSLNDEGQIGVKLVNQQNIVEFRPVTILSDEPKAMYISGLPQQARVITVGQEFVQEGQTVNPVPAEGDGLL